MSKKTNKELEMLDKIYQAIIFGLCFIQGLFCKSIYLTPTEAYVDVNKSLTFTCTYIGYGEVFGTKWNINNTHTPSIIRSLDGSCSGNGIFANDAIYRVGCPSETSFTVTILRVQLEDHNVPWKCFDRERSSNSVTVFVTVPVVSVILTLSDESSSIMKEYSRQTIKCRTSTGRPKPNVNWYLQESTSSEKHKIAVNSSTRIISSIGDGLVAVENTLLFYPNRSINNWMLYCEGWTDNENRTVGSNKKIKMNITYHPDIPPTIFGFNNSKKYRLIESEVGKLSCSVYGGNPLPRLTWNCYNNKQTPNIIDGKTVFSNVTWTGSRNQTSCSCISHHSWSGITQTTTVTIDALYPPQKPIFAINGKGVSYVINVILNKTLQVMCESKSNPSPNYTWTGSLLSLRTAQVLVVTINDTYSRIYNCLAKNTMVRNNNTHVDGQNEANMTVKVLYPPEKLSFKYEYKNGTHANLDEMIDVIEEDSFTILCDAVGNPSPFIQWDGQTIKNVLKITSIMSDTNKTCTATNEMEETVGESRTGFTSATVLISVLYPPRIPTISISNGKRYINVTTSVQLTEKDSINMTCYSAANPKPNYTWASHNTKIQNNVRQFVDLSRTDTGSYTCNVNNMLRRTFGEAMSGSNFSSIFLNILYHSTILSIKDTSILEGSNLTVICHVQQGNPSEEFFSWTRLGDSKIWDGNQLIIDNVSREDDTNYTCSLTSRIIPTIGNETEMVIKRSFHLNVFFPTKIKYFSVGGRKNRETYIVNNMDDVSIECTAEGNPASNLSLSHLPGKSISTEESKNSLHHNITNASFENAGLYTCEGRNNYTIYRAPISRLILIVKCKCVKRLGIYELQTGYMVKKLYDCFIYMRKK